MSAGRVLLPRRNYGNDGRYETEARTRFSDAKLHQTHSHRATNNIYNLRYTSANEKLAKAL